MRMRDIKVGQKVKIILPKWMQYMSEHNRIGSVDQIGVKTVLINVPGVGYTNVFPRELRAR